MTWIKLHRQIQDSQIWSKRYGPFDSRSAWIDLLLLASHNERKIIKKPNKKKVSTPNSTKLGRGDFFASIRFLMKRWKWGNSKTQAYLQLLIQLRMISKVSTQVSTQVSTPSGTIYHIVNYDTYQGREIPVSTQVSTQVSTRVSTKPRIKEQELNKQEEDRQISSSGSDRTTEFSFLKSFRKDCQRRAINPEKEYERFVLECQKLGVDPWEEFERRHQKA